ncbi:MAG: hypothetical protein NWF07_13750 [Candidatus Bathyarchaeota archaeon]|nr:hypothetical protein [Candidatus Bathyarchaeota archaeon]
MTVNSIYDDMEFDSFEVAKVYVEEQRHAKAGRSGYFGMMKAKMSKNQMDFMGTKEQRKPTDMTVTKGGVTVVVPGEWFTQTGKIRKSKKAAYEALFIKEALK